MHVSLGQHGCDHKSITNGTNVKKYMHVTYNFGFHPQQSLAKNILLEANILAEVSASKCE